ncbi:MAG: polysaccharide pyruvyl transferase family protein [Pseudomonadales bacterium]|jgi:colanic acid/amylovoran biosynthesis protein|nr:polysaccharide pyruvyl transferase family protein [Pseudomonadales bacterium]
MSHFLISGITGLRNRGVDALVRSIVHELRARDPECRITVVSKTPDYDGLRLAALDVAVVRDPYAGPIGFLRYLLVRWLRVALLLAWSMRAYREALAGADTLLVSGGDVFSSDYGDFDRYVQHMRDARAAGLRVHLLAHSIGRFAEGDIARWRRLERLVDHGSVRERASLDYLQGEIRSGLAWRLVADVAFLLPPAGEPFGEWLEHRVIGTRPCIVMSVSQGVSRFAGADSHAHLDALAELVEALLEEDPDASVVLLPHVQELSVRNDDSLLVHALEARLRHTLRVSSLAGQYTANEYKALLGRADFVVAERMHAAIGALSQAVPTISLGYSIKFEGVMSECYAGSRWAEAGNVQLSRFVAEPAATTAEILDAFRSRAAMREVLARNVPDIISRARSAFDW